jgi:hypothetical protein
LCRSYHDHPHKIETQIKQDLFQGGAHLVCSTQNQRKTANDKMKDDNLQVESILAKD